MKKTPYQKTCLKLAIVFCLIGIAAAYGMVELIYDAYSGGSIEFTIKDGTPLDLFGPHQYQFDDKDWQYRHRFDFDPFSKTVNC